MIHYYLIISQFNIFYTFILFFKCLCLSLLSLMVFIFIILLFLYYQYSFLLFRGYISHRKVQTWSRLRGLMFSLESTVLSKERYLSLLWLWLLIFCCCYHFFLSPPLSCFAAICSFPHLPPINLSFQVKKEKKQNKTNHVTPLTTAAVAFSCLLIITFCDFFVLCDSCKNGARCTLLHHHPSQIYLVENASTHYISHPDYKAGMPLLSKLLAASTFPLWASTFIIKVLQTRCLIRPLFEMVPCRSMKHGLGASFATFFEGELWTPHTSCHLPSSLCPSQLPQSHLSASIEVRSSVTTITAASYCLQGVGRHCTGQAPLPGETGEDGCPMRKVMHGVSYRLVPLRKELLRLHYCGNIFRLYAADGDVQQGLWVDGADYQHQLLSSNASLLQSLCFISFLLDCHGSGHFLTAEWGHRCDVVLRSFPPEWQIMDSFRPLQKKFLGADVQKYFFKCKHNLHFKCSSKRFVMFGLITKSSASW